MIQIEDYVVHTRNLGFLCSTIFLFTCLGGEPVKRSISFINNYYVVYVCMYEVLLNGKINYYYVYI